MKAALLIEPRKIEIRDIPMPELHPGEVLIQVKSCGVCSTDVKKFTGDSKAPFLPFILGHEPAGVIVETGNGVVKSLTPGKRVAIAPVVLCGECAACRSGLPQSQGMGMCANYQVLGFSTNGAFAEYMVAPAANVHPIPDSLSFRDAGLIEPVAACANGVLRTVHQIPGTVVVVGAGFMGLVTILLLKHLGSRVVALDLVEERRKIAAALGADLTLDPASGDVSKAVKDYTAGLGADGVICAAGGKAIVEEALGMLAKGGTLLLLASSQAGTKFEVDLNKMHYDQTVVTGSVSYTAPGFQWAIDLLSRGEIDVNPLITHTGGLDRAAEFLDMTKNMVGIKKVVLL